MFCSLVFFVAAGVLCVGVLGLEHRLATRGNDVSYEVKLEKPVNLYGEYHPTLFVSDILYTFAC